MSATGTESLQGLTQLKSVSVGIHSLENFDFLNTLPSSLEKLFLGATKSKKPVLSGLRRLANLKELYVEGQSRDIEAIGELKLLEKLVLRSVGASDIGFVRKLGNLWSLDIKLGGITNLSSIEGLENLKYLELWMVKGLSDITVISSLSGLQYLFLQALKNVESIPDLGGLNKLRRVHLDTMKGLSNLDGLFQAKALEDYIHVCAQNMQPLQYAPLLELQTLKRALFGFGSRKKNEIMDEMMREKGIEKYAHEPFRFS